MNTPGTPGILILFPVPRKLKKRVFANPSLPPPPQHCRQVGAYDSNHPLYIQNMNLAQTHRRVMIDMIFV